MRCHRRVTARASDIPEPQIKARARASGRRRTQVASIMRISRSTLRSDRVLRARCEDYAAARRQIAWRGDKRHRACRLSCLGREGDASCRAPSTSGEIMVWLRENLPAMTRSSTQGAGNFLRLGPPLLSRAQIRRTCRAPRQAPWAMGCRQLWRCRRSIAIVRSFAYAGDGDFLMTGQDFATAVQY